MPAPGRHEDADPFPQFPVDPDVAESDLPPSHIHPTVLAVIALGGALGALARWIVAEGLPHDAGQFPWDTLLTNVTGCFLIGVVMVLVIERWPRRPLIRPFFGTGILGGFTTFSTYAVDTRTLLAADRPGVALGYLAGTLAFGLVAVVAGLRATERVIRRCPSCWCSSGAPWAPPSAT
jgi:CrcB protein